MLLVHRRMGALVAALVLLGACLIGCGRREPVPTADVVAKLEDFKIGLSTDHVAAGDVVFGLQNQGPTVHELVVARTDLPADELPIGPDGLSVDEDTPKIRVLGEDEHVQLTEQGLLELALEQGHYVVFCNLEGHYLGGMREDLEVTG